MHYATPVGKVPLNSLNKFIKEMGLSKSEIQPSLKVTRSGLPSETARGCVGVSEQLIVRHVILNGVET